MIYLYSGTPGSGKSLHTAKEIIDRARYGHLTIGNFEVNLSRYKRARYRYIDNTELTPELLIGISRDYFKGRKVKEDTIMLIIDECQLLFNAREWQKSGRAEWLSFFTQHRKYGFRIVLVAQFDRMIDRQIRSLIEYEIIHRKVSNFGASGFFLSLVMGGNTFCAVKMWYPLRERVGCTFFHARKRFYSIYDSYGTFSEGASSPSKPSECSGATGLPVRDAGFSGSEVPAEQDPAENELETASVGADDVGIREPRNGAQRS